MPKPSLPRSARSRRTSFRFETLEGRRLMAADVETLDTNQIPPPVVYVDDDWNSTSFPDGADPDGPLGPATSMGFDAFDTIQEGVDAVASGGTVHVRAGTYSTSSIFHKSVHLLGAQAGIDPELRDLDTNLAVESTIVSRGPTFPALLVDPSRGLVTVDGFNISGGGTGTGLSVGGHFGDNAPPPTIVNNFIHDGLSYAVFFEGHAGLMQYNHIFNSGQGIYLSAGARNVTIADNYFHDNTGDFGDITLDHNNPGVTVRNNTFESDATAAGIILPQPEPFTSITNSDFSGVRIFENAFLGDVGVHNTEITIPTVNAERNWWGTTDDAQIEAKALGNVDFAPRLNEGVDSQPDVSGFQPPPRVVGITTVRVDNGKLTIDGDQGDNAVTITGIGTGTGIYEIATEQGTQTVHGITADIVINLGSGDDHLTMNNAYVNGAIDIQMADGNDVVMLGQQEVVSTRTDLNIYLGAGDDVVDGKRLYVGRNQTILGGNGYDDLIFDGFLSPEFTLGTSAAGSAVWAGGTGQDQVHIIYAFIVGNFTVHLGGGEDVLDIFGSAVSGNVAFIGGNGKQKFTVDTNFFDADLLIDAGAERDEIFLAHGLGTEINVVNSGAGDDLIFVRNHVARQIVINTAAAQNDSQDSVDVRGSAFDQFFVLMGDEFDYLAVYGNLVRYETDFDGGAGSDFLANLGNDFRGAYRNRGFEDVGPFP